MKNAIELIEAQQKKVKERSAAWMVGEQLKDICRAEPKSAELIAQDLQVEKMSIVEAEKKIKAFADGHKVGNFACVTPKEADGILRKFYGLPAAGSAGARAGTVSGPYDGGGDDKSSERAGAASAATKRAAARMELDLEELLS